MDGTYQFLKQYERVVDLDNKAEKFVIQSEYMKEALKLLDMDPHTLLEKEVLELYNIYEDGGIDKRIVRNKIGNNYFALSEHSPDIYDEIFEDQHRGGKTTKKRSTKRNRKSRNARSKNTRTKKRVKKRVKKSTMKR